MTARHASVPVTRRRLALRLQTVLRLLRLHHATAAVVLGHVRVAYHPPLHRQAGAAALRGGGVVTAQVRPTDVQRHVGRAGTASIRKVTSVRAPLFIPAGVTTAPPLGATATTVRHHGDVGTTAHHVVGTVATVAQSLRLLVIAATDRLLPGVVVTAVLPRRVAPCHPRRLGVGKFSPQVRHLLVRVSFLAHDRLSAVVRHARLLLCLLAVVTTPARRLLPVQAGRTHGLSAAVAVGAVARA